MVLQGAAEHCDGPSDSILNGVLVQPEQGGGGGVGAAVEECSKGLAQSFVWLVVDGEVAQESPDPAAVCPSFAPQPTAVERQGQLERD
jgi:hypothetical protein